MLELTTQPSLRLQRISLSVTGASSGWAQSCSRRPIEHLDLAHLMCRVMCSLSPSQSYHLWVMSMLELLRVAIRFASKSLEEQPLSGVRPRWASGLRHACKRLTRSGQVMSLTVARSAQLHGIGSTAKSSHMPANGLKIWRLAGNQGCCVAMISIVVMMCIRSRNQQCRVVIRPWALHNVARVR